MGLRRQLLLLLARLLIIVYHMLKEKRPYQDFGASHYEQQYKQRVLKNLQRRAKRLGMELVPLPQSAASYRVEDNVLE